MPAPSARLQPTISRDGVPRLTMRVEHRVQRAVLLDALACARYQDWAVGDRPVVARRALTLLRRYLQFGWMSWRESVAQEGDDEDECALERASERASDAWAEAQVGRLWPDP